MIRIALVSVAALALSGCGNLCDRYANVSVRPTAPEIAPRGRRPRGKREG